MTSGLFLLSLPAAVPEVSAAALRGALGRDALSAPIGFLLLGLGLAAGALAFSRRRTAEPALLYFAAFTTLYAVRVLIDSDTLELLFDLPRVGVQKALNVLTYAMLLPALLLLQRMIGPRWGPAVRRLWQASLVLVAVAVPWEIASATPGRLLVVERVLALLTVAAATAALFSSRLERGSDLRVLRGSFLVAGVFVVLENLRALGLVPWRENAESVGILVLIGGLGWVAARRVFASEENLAAIRQELETARRIQAAILPEAPPRLPGVDLAVRYVPAAEVAGDFYEFLPGEGRRVGVVVADVSGHGVPAALVASMLKVAVAAEAEHAASPGRLLSAINRIFHGKLKSQFITAASFYLDLEQGRLTYASAGHPPALHWRARENRVEELAQGGLVLGRLRLADYAEASVPLGPGDRVLLFTDGIPEALGPAGEPLGEESLRELLAEHATAGAEEIAGAVIARVAGWTGRQSGFDDDLTLVVAAVEG